MKLPTFFSDLVDVVFPPVCHGCGGHLVPGERYICQRCIERLPRTLYHRRPLNPMEERFAGRIPFEKATGWFFYSRESTMARMIHDFKYRGFPSLARELGRIVGEEIFPTGFMTDIDVIIPVPIHVTRRLHRGYNQAECFAKGLSDVTEIPVGKELRAIRRHSTQTGKTLSEREKNLEGVFYVKEAESLKGRNLLVVDDVCTTGSTILEAVKTLDKATGKSCKFTILTLAVT